MNTERHTAVLAVSIAVLASAILHPIDWRSFAGLVLSGCLLTLGGEMAERGHWGFGAASIGLSLLLAAIAIVHGLSGSTSWWWVQGAGIYFVSTMLLNIVAGLLKSARKPTKP